jgi:hypothetical protein
LRVLDRSTPVPSLRVPDGLAAPRRPALLRGSLAVLVALAGLAAAGAASGASATLIAAEPGDTFSIQGTEIQCGVSTSGPRAFACYIGTEQTQLAHSWATDALDEGAAIFAATGNHQVVAKKLGPTVTGSLLTAPSHKPMHYTLTKAQHVGVVGSRILCNSGVDDSGNQTFACGVINPPHNGVTVTGFMPGTYVTIISDKGAYIQLVGENATYTAVAFKQQP